MHQKRTKAAFLISRQFRDVNISMTEHLEGSIAINLPGEGLASFIINDSNGTLTLLYVVLWRMYVVSPHGGVKWVRSGSEEVSSKYNAKQADFATKIQKVG